MDQQPDKDPTSKNTKSFDEMFNESITSTENDLRELLAEALKMDVDNRKRKRSQKMTSDAVTASIQEFYKNFIVIGYDIDGNQQIIRHSKSQMDNDALNSLIFNYMSSLLYRGDG